MIIILSLCDDGDVENDDVCTTPLVKWIQSDLPAWIRLPLANIQLTTRASHHDDDDYDVDVDDVDGDDVDDPGDLAIPHKTLYPAWKRQRVRCIRCKKSRCLEEAERKKQSWQTEGNSDHGHHFLSLLGHILGPALVSLGIISIVSVQLMATIEAKRSIHSMMYQKF